MKKRKYQLFAACIWFINALLWSIMAMVDLADGDPFTFLTALRA